MKFEMIVCLLVSSAMFQSCGKENQSTVKNAIGYTTPNDSGSAFTGSAEYLSDSSTVYTTAHVFRHDIAQKLIRNQNAISDVYNCNFGGFQGAKMLAALKMPASIFKNNALSIESFNERTNINFVQNKLAKVDVSRLFIRGRNGMRSGSDVFGITHGDSGAMIFLGTPEGTKALGIVEFNEPGKINLGFFHFRGANNAFLARMNENGVISELAEEEVGGCRIVSKIAVPADSTPVAVRTPEPIIVTPAPVLRAQPASCNKPKLAQCLKFNGGRVCYEKWGCKIL